MEQQTAVAPFRSPPEDAAAGTALLECTICMEAFAEGVLVRTLPCMHRYHAACVDRWLASSPECPICKYRLDPPPPQPQQQFLRLRPPSCGWREHCEGRR